MPTDQSYNERELLLQVANGDVKAFEVLFGRWYNKLGGFVIRWTNSEALAEEIVQDVFLKIWLQRSVLAEVQHFDKYLFTVSRNHTFNALKKREREKKHLREWLSAVEPDVDFPAEWANSKSDYSFLVEQAVQQLPEQQKKVYTLKYKEGNKYEAIGNLMGIAPETARKHMQAAVKSITRYLKENISILLIISKIF